MTFHYRSNTKSPPSQGGPQCVWCILQNGKDEATHTIFKYVEHFDLIGLLGVDQQDIIEVDQEHLQRGLEAHECSFFLSHQAQC